MCSSDLSCIGHPRCIVGANPGKAIGNDNQQGIEGGDDSRSSNKAISVMNIFRQLRQKRRLLPLKLRQQPVFRSSMNAVSEYQEIVEDEGEQEEELAPPNDSMRLFSQRSSRNNIGTGRSMLVRQNAQVFSRPSTTKTKRDISASFSSDSPSLRNALQRQSSLTLDDFSCD